MNRTLIAFSLGMGALVLATQQALAEAPKRNCAQRDQVLERLTTKFGETRQSIGLGSKNRVLEVYASDETGTWTVTVTMPTGKTCIVAAGRSFENLVEDLPPAGNPV